MITPDDSRGETSVDGAESIVDATVGEEVDATIGEEVVKDPRVG